MMDSQMSQASDAYPSSILDAESLRSLDCIHFDLTQDFRFHTPDPSSSRQALPSASDSDFTRLALLEPPPLIPEDLRRVGPDRTKAYVLYSDMTRDKFVSWWLETGYGKGKRINWEAKRNAKCWEQFDQVAHRVTGKPGVICNQCNAILDHPATRHSGTSSLNKHMNGPGCRKSLGKQTNILRALQQAVC
jgi:hypothetical protein